MAVPPRTKLHRHRLVPRFSLSSRAALENTLIDRMALTVNRWETVAPRDEILSSIYRLGFTTVAGDETGEVNLFQQRRPRPPYSRQFLPLRGTGQGQGTGSVSPIVGGQLTTRMFALPQQREGSDETTVRSVTSLQGTFNPTRWIMAQRPMPGRHQGTVDCARPFAFAIARKDDWWRRELPYVENNNVIIGADPRFSFARSKPAEEHLRDYVTYTLETLTESLDEVGLVGMREAFPSEFLLGDIEFYWEFDAADPISLVETLKYYCTSVSAVSGVDPRNVIFEPDSEDSFVPSGSMTENRTAITRSSISFWFNGRTGVRFKVYAKTNRRIRFEVCLSPEYRPAEVRRRSFDSITALVDGVRLLKANAVQMMNSVLDDAFPSFSKAEPRISPETFVNIVAAHSNGPEVAHSIISELRAYGRVAPFPHDPRYQTLRSLRRVGVLRMQKSAPRVYTLTNGYRAAAAYPQPLIYDG